MPFCWVCHEAAHFPFFVSYMGSSLGAQVILFVLACGGSNVKLRKGHNERSQSTYAPGGKSRHFRTRTV